MQLLKNHSHIHGFEDYNIVVLSDSCFYNTSVFYLPYSYDNSTGAYLITKDLSVNIYRKEDTSYPWINTVAFEPELATNHKELLDTAKKVFTHQNCKLSRSMMAEKYRKSLNPFLSDAVIIPKPEYWEFRLRKEALFINEAAKLIVKIWINDDRSTAIIQNAEEGDKFKNLITCQLGDSYGSYKPYKIDAVLESEFFYYGDLLYVPNSQSWALEVLTHIIPADKIVFEDSVQESLSSETNQLDFDSLCSIKDMLESSDENTVSAGLKSLSMMDWMHYPQSIKFILSNISNKYNWIYNKACNSTSVKYMIKTIAGNYAKRRTWWPGQFDTEIYEADFELFKKLKCHYHHVEPKDVLDSIRSINFVRINDMGLIVPNIKVRTE